MSQATPTKDEIKQSIAQTAELWAPSSTAREGASQVQIVVQRDALAKALGRLQAIKFNCEHCAKFQMEACDMHGPIPREYIKTEAGCPDWAYDGVPW